MKEKQNENYFVIAGAMLLFFGCGVLFYETYLWTKAGSWHTVPLATGLQFIGVDDIRTGHSDSQHFVDWLLKTPLCIWFIIIGAIIMVFGQMVRAVNVSR
jgi:hypothetical protein